MIVNLKSLSISICLSLFFNTYAVANCPKSIASIKSYMQTLNRLKSLGFAVDKDLEESQGRIEQLEQDQAQLLIAP